MKKPETVLKELRYELRYWQGQYNLELSGLRRTRAKIKQIGASMRAAQKMIRAKKAKACK